MSPLEATEFVDGLNALLASVTALVATTAGLVWAVVKLRSAARSWRQRQSERSGHQALQPSEEGESQDAAASE